MTPSAWKEQAPESYRVEFETSKGNFAIEVTRAWAPLGADRFYNLVKSGFYNEARFFRVLPGFVVQFGLPGDPGVGSSWRSARITDDSVTQSNRPGYLSFATAGPNTRTTQVFINLGDNAGLDRMGFAPFGQVVSGMDIVEQLYSGYGEGAPGGRGPEQGRIHGEGNVYLEKDFPKLDYIRSARLTNTPEQG
jgi:peptidyl-prolyl cis-trans isomerase A (cyclophilin A)